MRRTFYMRQEGYSHGAPPYSTADFISHLPGTVEGLALYEAERSENDKERQAARDPRRKRRVALACAGVLLTGATGFVANAELSGDKSAAAEIAAPPGSSAYNRALAAAMLDPNILRRSNTCAAELRQESRLLELMTQTGQTTPWPPEQASQAAELAAAHEIPCSPTQTRFTGGAVRTRVHDMKLIITKRTFTHFNVDTVCNDFNQSQNDPTSWQVNPLRKEFMADQGIACAPPTERPD
ncbi:MAG TPA: hypothetical protein VD735_02310 [Candidatus Saccharimonadales bacterium]|nr:hypothetical protein [Candidatus Saccharimonadales bacterium]